MTKIIRKRLSIKTQLIIAVFLVYSSFAFSQKNKAIDSLEIVDILNKAQKFQSEYKYEKALENYQLAIQISKQKKFENLYFQSNTELGSFYISTNNINAAIETLNSISPNEKIPNILICNYYHRKAYLFNQTRKIDSALFYAQKALVIANKRNFHNSKGIIYNEMASIYEKQQNTKKAFFYYNNALEIFKDDIVYYSNIAYNKAHLYYLINDYKNAINLLKKNVALIEDTKLYATRQSNYSLLRECYFKTGDSLNGFKAESEERLMAIQTKTADYDKNFKELEIKYKIKEKDNLLLKSDEKRKKLNSYLISVIFFLTVSFLFYIKLKNTNKKLNIAVLENNFLLEELNHRIKNNLQLIVSLVASETKKNNGTELNMLTNISTKIESIATLHQQLYLNNKKEMISLKLYLNDILDNLTPIIETYKIKTSYNFEEVAISINKALYIGLIVNELIINSIKHAFINDTDKTIYLDYNIIDNSIIFNFMDNGTGIMNNNTPKFIETLCQQLKAEYQITNINGFQINIKIEL